MKIDSFVASNGFFFLCLSRTMNLISMNSCYACSASALFLYALRLQQAAANVLWLIYSPTYGSIASSTILLLDRFLLFTFYSSLYQNVHFYNSLPRRRASFSRVFRSNCGYWSAPTERPGSAFPAARYRYYYAHIWLTLSYASIRKQQYTHRPNSKFI